MEGWHEVAKCTLVSCPPCESFNDIQEATKCLEGPSTGESEMAMRNKAVL